MSEFTFILCPRKIGLLFELGYPISHVKKKIFTLKSLSE